MDTGRVSGTSERQVDPGQPTAYEIRVEGHLGSNWSDWFEGLGVTPEQDGTTLLSGPVADQAALHGLLRSIRDLGMALVSVHRTACPRTDHIDATTARRETDAETSSSIS
jgi:hypothetical protein